MTQRTALLIEASGIQEYVFGSNELTQNIGASELVMQATTDWLFAADTGLLPEPYNVQRTVQRGAASRWRVDDRSLDEGLKAEVVYAGGGNALILFSAEEDAQTLAYALTRRALEEAPGLRLVIGWQSYGPGQLAATVQHLREERISGWKRQPQRSSPLMGLGVTAACTFSAAPAVGRDQNGRYISAEVRAKQRIGIADGAGNQRLMEYLGDILEENFGFVYDFEQFGEREDFSYLAVVHTDGNRMGARIKNYVKRFAGDDTMYTKAYRTFSIKVQEAAHNALTSTVGVLLAPDNLVFSPDEHERWRYKIGAAGGIDGKIPVWIDASGIERLPFRPIVFGGDDVTFVCEGRLGLPLAAHYLARLGAELLPDNEPLYARAGIAIVKTHYPFARAYALADELCDSAKRLIKTIDREKRQVAALDWHFAVNGLVQPLAQLREREYQVTEGSLLMRPVRLLPADDNEWQSWDTFNGILDAFVTDREWENRRNKVKALRDALRGGPAVVQLFVKNLAANLQLPNTVGLTSIQQARKTGWHGDRCVYFDAVEALDFYISLKGV